MSCVVSRLTALLLLLTATLTAQGPVVLMAVDAENAGPGGPIPGVISNASGTGVLDHVTNGGANILVIGGGKSAVDNVTVFWNSIDAALPNATVTYVHGAANIAAQSFAGFAMLVVVSDEVSTPSGGLTNAENAALGARAGDIASFVNSGGGLLGFSSKDLASPYAYLGVPGMFTFGSPASISTVSPTPAGLAIGITGALGTCDWRDEFTECPGYLNVLATNDATGNACALGGVDTVIVSIVLTPFTATTCIGQNHIVTATVFDGFGVPQVGTAVSFSVLAGPNTGLLGAGATNGAGQTTFAYTSAVAGTDTIQACFVNPMSIVQCTTATVNWAPPPFFEAISPCGQTLMASVGVPVSFSVAATAMTGAPNNNIILSVTGAPVGATHTPALPTIAFGATATASTLFTWIPTNADVGSHVITYTATDSCIQTITCEVTIVVAECYLLLGFTEAAVPLGPEADDVLRVLPVVMFPVTMTEIPALHIPNDLSLLNLSVAAQVGMLNASVFPLNPLQFSNGMRVIVGSGIQAYGPATGIALTGDPMPALGADFHFSFVIQ